MSSASGLTRCYNIGIQDQCHNIAIQDQCHNMGIHGTFPSLAMKVAMFLNQKKKKKSPERTMEINGNKSNDRGKKFYIDK